MPTTSRATCNHCGKDIFVEPSGYYWRHTATTLRDCTGPTSPIWHARAEPRPEQAFVIATTTASDRSSVFDDTLYKFIKDFSNCQVISPNDARKAMGMPPLDECVFCQKISDKDVDPTRHAAVKSFTPLNPVTPGHKLFVPVKHMSAPHEDPQMAGLVFEHASMYAAGQGRDYNLIVNSGSDAGQTIKHLHIHYVPRSKDDGLVMPWDAQKKATENPTVTPTPRTYPGMITECTTCVEDIFMDHNGRWSHRQDIEAEHSRLGVRHTPKPLLSQPMEKPVVISTVNYTKPLPKDNDRALCGVCGSAITYLRGFWQHTSEVNKALRNHNKAHHPGPMDPAASFITNAVLGDEAACYLCDGLLKKTPLGWNHVSYWVRTRGGHIPHEGMPKPR